MSTQITVPVLDCSNEYLRVAEKQAPVLGLINNLLSESSPLKKGVDHDPSTVIASANVLVGAMLANGSLELAGPLYEMFKDVILAQVLKKAGQRGLPEGAREALEGICKEVRELRPFAHRTTVQGLLNGHTQASSDQLLNRSFQQGVKELGEVGYKPPEVAVNQDPHFADFKPSFRNGDIRQVLIGGRTTLKTGYQFNLANITPLGLYSAIDFAPKRQENAQDLGDLRYAVTFGKAADRARLAGLTVRNFQGDRALEVAGLFVVSHQHAWPASSGEVRGLAEFTEGVYLVTPWSSTRQTKADLIAQNTFAEVAVASSSFLRSQYAGTQALAKVVLGPSPKSKVLVETAILTLRKQGGSYRDFSPAEVQAELSALQREVKENAELAESLKEDYFRQLRLANPKYKERGLLMKLNAKSEDQLAGEPAKAWATRKQYNRARRAGKRLQKKLDSFLREFQVFEIGVDEAGLKLLKEPPCKARARLVSTLKSLGKGYDSRWCIEAGFETIEYQFPVHYRGYSTDTHLRIYALQAIVFNGYRVAQVKHVGAGKPHNWRPWEPRKKIRNRRFSAADLRGFTAKGYLLSLLKDSMEMYFRRKLS